MPAKCTIPTNFSKQTFFNPVLQDVRGSSTKNDERSRNSVLASSTSELDNLASARSSAADMTSFSVFRNIAGH